MFDLRYHVASLAAVFFALVIGILVGVALASHGLSNGDRLNFERQIREGNAKIDSLNAQLQAVQEDSNAGRTFLDRAYEGVMSDRLQGKKVAVLFVGSSDPATRSAVTKTLGDAGGTLLRLRSVSLPIKPKAVNRALRGHAQLTKFAGHMGDIGRELADEFAVGGDTPVWDALEQQLVEERRGADSGQADGVVVVRTAPVQKGASSQLVKALVGELSSQSVPTVGVETTQVHPSWVPFFDALGLTTVDNVDQRAGRISLAVVLSGSTAPGGHYGTRAGDDSVMPDVPPVVTTTASG